MNKTINKRECPECKRALTYSNINDLKKAAKTKSICRFCAGSSLDHTNKRFGRLVAIGPTKHRIRRQVVWKCLCDCGKEVFAGATDLQMGSKKSCGCLTAWKGHGEISGSYWCHLRNMAKKRNIPLNVSKEDAWELFIKQGGRCAYTGLSLNFLRAFQYGRGQSASLDRIDSNKPYDKDNIQWVHQKVNLMKGTLSSDEFLNFCNLIAKKIVPLSI